MFTKVLYDRALPERNFTLMHLMVIGTVTYSLTSMLMGSVRTYYGQVFGGRLTSELTLLFFNHVQHLEVRFFDERRVGEILSRAGDLQRSVSFVTGLFQSVLVNGVYLILIPPLLFALNWQLALLSLAAVPVTTGISLLTGRYMRMLSRRSMELAADTSGFQFEALSNVRIVKAVAAEPDIFDEMRNRLVNVQASRLKVSGVGILLGIANSAVKAVSTVAFSWVAWTQILDGRLSIGSFIAFSAYLGYLTGPVGQFASLYTDLQQATVSLSRFFEYYDAPVEQDPMVSTRPVRSDVKRVTGAIRFENVTFGYDPMRPVLRDVSFSIGPGGVTALVGRSGAGKSSIVKLLLRMYAPQSGTVSVDGVNVDAYALAELRQQTGVVWQDNGVLRGSFRENLMLGARSVEERELWDALRLARLDEFVRALPNGLDTTIAEWGGTLSGGQRQRLAVARAVLRRPPILIFDEATSNLDPETEEELIKAILPRQSESTILFVTHRLVTASLASRIFIAADGSISGGTAHQDMLASHEGYRALWNSAMGGVPANGVRFPTGRFGPTYDPERLSRV
jgi:ABC-type bacteriocin/lantibiotic exporter with double-glycine peptidase domain